MFKKTFFKTGELVIRDIVTTYPFLVFIYAASIILSRFSKSFANFFNWPAFNLGMAIFSVLAVPGYMLLSRHTPKKIFNLRTLAITYAKAAVFTVWIFIMLSYSAGIALFLSTVLGLVFIIFRVNSKIAATVTLLVFFLALLFFAMMNIAIAEQFILCAYILLASTILCRWQTNIEKKAPISYNKPNE